MALPKISCASHSTLRTFFRYFVMILRGSPSISSQESPELESPPPVLARVIYYSFNDVLFAIRNSVIVCSCDLAALSIWCFLPSFSRISLLSKFTVDGTFTTQSRDNRSCFSPIRTTALVFVKDFTRNEPLVTGASLCFFLWGLKILSSQTRISPGAWSLSAAGRTYYDLLYIYVGPLSSSCLLLAPTVETIAATRYGTALW